MGLPRSCDQKIRVITENCKRERLYQFKIQGLLKYTSDQIVALFKHSSAIPIIEEILVTFEFDIWQKGFTARRGIYLSIYIYSNLFKNCNYCIIVQKQTSKIYNKSKICNIS